MSKWPTETTSVNASPQHAHSALKRLSHHQHPLAPVKFARKATYVTNAIRRVRVAAALLVQIASWAAMVVALGITAPIV